VERADVVVVGGGIIGVCSAAVLAERGRDVLLLERSAAAGAVGSSRGTARFRQLENHPDVAFLDLGVRARTAWGVFETEATAPIFHPTGNLSFGDPQGLAAFGSALRERGLPCEEVTGAEVHARWPILRARIEAALYQPDGEVIAADVAHASVLRVAEHRGVRVRRGVTATAIEPGASGAVVRMDGNPLVARQVVLAAGPWVGPLARTVGIDLPVEVTRQTVAWFGWRDDPPPTLTEWSGREPYLLWDPGGGLKTAEHRRGPLSDPDDAAEPDDAAIERMKEWIAETFVAPFPPPSSSDTCLYTNAPDDRFVIEREGDVVVVSACSGHAFQYAPAIGGDVADALSD
jgi:sarcosine oxidase